MCHGRTRVTDSSLKSHAVLAGHNPMKTHTNSNHVLCDICDNYDNSAIFYRMGRLPIRTDSYGLPHKASKRWARPQLNL